MEGIIMPINPIAKIRFMRKRLTHGITRGGPKKKIGLAKINNDSKVSYPIQIQKHQLQNVGKNTARIKYQNMITKI